MPYDLNYLQNAAIDAASNRRSLAVAGHPLDTSSQQMAKGGKQFNEGMQALAKAATQYKNMRTPQASVKPDAGSDDGGYATDTQDG